MTDAPAEQRSSAVGAPASSRPGAHPLRIAYLIPEFPGQTHGFFLREARALEGRGFEVVFVSTRPPRSGASVPAQRPSQPVHYLTPLRLQDLPALLQGLGATGLAGARRALSGWREARVEGVRSRLRLLALLGVGARLAALARREGIEHVHVHSCADAAHVALFARRLSGLPYSLTLHGPLDDYGGNQAQKWRESRFGIVITRRLLAEVHERLDGALPARIEVAPMGVETQAFRRRRPYQAWDGHGPFRVVSCARLHRNKGHDVLIRAVRLLRDTGLDARLRIAGEDNTDGSCRSALEAQIAADGLEEAVALLGAIPEAAVRDELESAHAFALASTAEPLGVALMEAMAMELPLVATAAGGVPELVSDGRDGLLVPPGDPQRFAAALAELARHPERAAALSQAGRRTVTERFGSERSAAVLASLLRGDTAPAEPAAAPESAR